MQYVGIDLIRGLAAFAVLITHARSTSFAAYGALPAEGKTVAIALFFGLTRLGHEAVIVFFALSGFLVAGKAIEAIVDGRFNLAEYAIDRSTRILIPLAAACVLTACVYAMNEGRWPPIWQVAGNAVGLNGTFVGTLKYNSALWSLACEIWFYVILGAAASFACWFRYGVTVLLLSLLVFAHLGALYLLIWSIGALAYLQRFRLQRRSVAFVGAWLTALGVLMFQLQSESQAIASMSAFWGSSHAEIVISLGTSLMLPLFATRSSNEALQSIRKIAGFASDVSYSLYLTHMPCLAVSALMWPPQPTVNVFSFGLLMVRVVVCVLIAWLFHMLFEQWSYSVRRRLKELVGQMSALGIGAKVKH